MTRPRCPRYVYAPDDGGAWHALVQSLAVAYRAGRLTPREYALLPAAWPPLIGREVWEAVQRFRRGRHPKSAVRPTVRAKAHALLSGLAFCANCGAKLHYSHHGDGPTRRNYFRCSCRENGGHCNARPSRADRLDAHVEAVLGGLSISPAAVARARELVRAAALTPAPPRQPDTDERLRRLARAYADGAYTDEEYAARRAAIQAAGAAPEPPPQLDLDRAAALEQALALVGSIPQLWAANAIPRRRALLGQLLSHVYARDHRIYAIRPTRAAEPLFRAIWAEADRGTPSCSPPVGSRPILLAAA